MTPSERPSSELAGAVETVTIRAGSLEELDAVAAMANAAYGKSEGHVFAGTTRTQRDDL